MTIRWGGILLVIGLQIGAALADPYAEDLDELGSKNSCKRGIASGCYNLGVDLYNAKRPDEAYGHFQTACEKGMGLACFQMGRIDESRADLDQARAHYEAAVKAGYADAQQRINALSAPAPQPVIRKNRK
jgi:TPR repeat protein